MTDVEVAAISIKEKMCSCSKTPEYPAGKQLCTTSKDQKSERILVEKNGFLSSTTLRIRLIYHHVTIFYFQN